MNICVCGYEYMRMLVLVAYADNVMHERVCVCGYAYVGIRICRRMRLNVGARECMAMYFVCVRACVRSGA